MIWFFLLYREIRLPSNSNYFLIASCESPPLKESRLSAEQGDVSDLTILVADWRVDESIRKSMLEYYIELKAYLESNDIADVEIKPSLSLDNRSWIKRAYSWFHHMGVTRMGATADDSVVDKFSEVHGCSGLFIAGCSVLPTGSSSNPTFTAIALGLRVVDCVIERQQSSLYKKQV